jgi:hypothetical protein
MYTHGFSSLSAYIYIFYTSTIFVHVYHENTTLVYLTHSHIQHLTLKHPLVHTHIAHTDSTACMPTHRLSISSIFMTSHTPFYFSVSALYIYPPHTSIIHSHFARSVLSK